MAAIRAIIVRLLPPQTPLLSIAMADRASKKRQQTKDAKAHDGQTQYHKEKVAP